MRWRSVLTALGVAATATTALQIPPVASAASIVHAQGTVCVGDQLTDLDRLFDTEPAGIVGADYQRATQLPDGRVFWTFQDAAIRTAPDRIEIVHNVAAVQDGPCFTFLYRGTTATPASYLFAASTDQFERWFWPLGTTFDADGRINVFVAEMAERGPTYLSRAEPVATRLAIVDPATFDVAFEGSPADSSASLYGWSVTSDHAWTYLYAQCHRQFGFDELLGVRSHDRSCSARITVARVPVGQPLATPAYWDGARWQADPGRAAPIITTAGRRVNADQFVWTGGRFVSVNKEGDWWGDTIYVSTSSSAAGPFVVTAQVAATPKCSECNTFFASWVPFAAGARPPRTLAYGLSHNRWDGRASAFYRPTFATVPAPVFLPAGGVFRVPVPASAVVPVLTVTSVRPRTDGFVTVFPCDRPRPTASNLNFRAGVTTAATVLVRPDGQHRVCVYSSAATDLVVDLAGALDERFTPEQQPRRLLDTRGSARVAAGSSVEVEVPDGDAVAVNVAAVRPGDVGFLTVYPCDEAPPLASNLNYRPGTNVANLALVRSGTVGRICVYTSAETDLLVDLAGVFDGSFRPRPAPTRVTDTRAGTPVQPDDVLEVVVGDAAPAVVNVAAVRPTDDGYVTVFPCGERRPATSNLNFLAGTNVANLVVVRPDDRGRVCLTTSTATDLVIDLAGVLDAGFVPEPEPVRLVDTRLLP